MPYVPSLSPVPSRIQRIFSFVKRFRFYFALLVFYVVRRIRIKLRERREKLRKTGGKILLSYSAGGALWAYYHGLNAYLRDYFDLIDERTGRSKNIRVA